MKKLFILALLLFAVPTLKAQQYPSGPNVGLASQRPVICTAVNPVQPNQPDWFFATDTLIMSICVSANTWANVSSGGAGSVTSFSAGTLSPLFTTSVATPTSTPALSFSLSNAAAFTLFGNNTNASAAPSYTTMDSIFGSCSAATSALTYNTSTHAFGCNTTTVTIASGTATLGTSAISSGTCATTVTVAGTGVATTDAIIADFSADPTATTGYAPTAAGILTIIKFPTSGNVNFIVCNNTAASITPGAVTLNWRVTR